MRFPEDGSDLRISWESSRPKTVRAVLKFGLGWFGDLRACGVRECHLLSNVKQIMPALQVLESDLKRPASIFLLDLHLKEIEVTCELDLYRMGLFNTTSCSII